MKEEENVIKCVCRHSQKKKSIKTMKYFPFYRRHSFLASLSTKNERKKNKNITLKTKKTLLILYYY